MSSVLSEIQISFIWLQPSSNYVLQKQNRKKWNLFWRFIKKNTLWFKKCSGYNPIVTAVCLREFRLFFNMQVAMNGVSFFIKNVICLRDWTLEFHSSARPDVEGPPFNSFFAFPWICICLSTKRLLHIKPDEDKGRKLHFRYRSQFLIFWRKMIWSLFSFQFL